MYPRGACGGVVLLPRSGFVRPEAPFPSAWIQNASTSGTPLGILGREHRRAAGQYRGGVEPVDIVTDDIQAGTGRCPDKRSDNQSVPPRLRGRPHAMLAVILEVWFRPQDVGDFFLRTWRDRLVDLDLWD
jgi:hypothetical protein